MRIWGRVPDGLGGLEWIKVETAADGTNDAVYLTNLIQVLKLNLGESPFFAEYGIPAQPSVLTQVQPDFYMTLTQQLFAPQFAALTLAKDTAALEPTYAINCTFHNGAAVPDPVPV